MAFRSGRCPLCRTPIPPTFFDDLRISERGKSGKKQAAEAREDSAERAAVAKQEEEEFEWFYEARNGGWWRYETRQVSKRLLFGLYSSESGSVVDV